jgi:hypothetical protein
MESGYWEDLERCEIWKEEERLESGYWEDLDRSRSLEGSGKDGDWILGGSG